MMLQRRLGSILSSLAVLSLLGACATGQEDDFGGLSGAYSAGPADGTEGGDTEGTEGGDTEDEPMPVTSVGGTDPSPPGDSSGGDDTDGNPLCCQAHPSEGCNSTVTESCVCTSEPSCCQAVWTQECVDLAIACGDPYCEDDTGGESTDGGSTDGGSTGDPPEEPPPEEPPLYEDCPCLMQAGVDNFCHYGPGYPGCPMTVPGGYCDPNGDGSFAEGNWEQGWYDWHEQCT
jgi:hypothetical protein